MRWEGAALGAQFAGMALDSADFDTPVYRSTSLLACATGGAAFAEDEDQDGPPVYRCLSMPGAAEMQDPADAEERWLETMPPLVRRQRAGPL